MKKIYLLALSVAFTASAFAQTQLKRTDIKGLQSPKSTKKTVSEKSNAKGSNGGNSIFQLAGSLTSNNNYVAGGQMTLSFTLTFTNTDQEYADFFSLTFPAGITPVSSPDATFPTTDTGGGVESLNAISGQTISWGVDNNDQYGGIDLGPNTFSVVVNVAAGTTGAKVATFAASGDGFGAAPGDMTGSVTLNEQASTDATVLNVFLLRNGGSNCNVVAGDTLGMLIKNVGGSVINTGEPISYTVNGGTAVTESSAFINTAGTALIPSIASGDSAFVLFATALNFTATGTYTIVGSVSAAGDGVSSNNSFTLNFAHLSPIVLAASASLTEDFESATSATGWASQDVDGSGYSWALATIGNGTSATAIRAGEPNALGIATEDWLFTSCQDLTAGDQYSISYYQRLSSGSFGSLGVYYGMGQDYTLMTNNIVPDAALTANGTYAQITGNFTVATTGTYNFGFKATNSNTATGILLRVDDINITNLGNPLAVKNTNATKAISIFPNPSNGQFNITLANNSNVVVYDVLGAVVYSNRLYAGNNTISLTDLSNGVYFVKATANGEAKVERIVINK